MADLFSVSGLRVAITGGAGVLCSAIARHLAGAGASVAVLDIDEARASAVAKEITSAGDTAIGVKCDVLDRASLEAVSAKIRDSLGEVDVLINGAGGNRPAATTSAERSFFELPTEAFDFVFNLNFKGTLLPCQVFGQRMAEIGKGTILNISSMNAIRPLTNIPAYSAAKAAVSNFTQWLAVHLAQNYSKTIRVNAIAPGFLLTDQNRFLLVDEKSGERTARGQTIIDHTPMGRYGTAEDLFGTVQWLLSPGAGFLTGTVIPIDGGFAAFGGV